MGAVSSTGCAKALVGGLTALVLGVRHLYSCMLELLVKKMSKAKTLK